MNRFNIRLQPIVSLPSRQVYGYEVLSDVPEGISITKWFEQCGRAPLLQLRASQLETLDRQGIHAKFFVNLTTAILVNDENVAALLREPRPGIIELQDPLALSSLTTCALRHLAVNIRRLQQAGFEIWLDDYLSSYYDTLESAGLRFNGVKLDCAAFRQNCNDVADTARLIGEARRFGSLVLAEGIESLVDLRTACLAGADMAQGFYWPEHRIPAASSHRDASGCTAPP